MDGVPVIMEGTAPCVALPFLVNAVPKYSNRLTISISLLYLFLLHFKERKSFGLRGLPVPKPDPFKGPVIVTGCDCGKTKRKPFQEVLWERGLILFCVPGHVPESPESHLIGPRFSHPEGIY